jgi:hypothetical protein
LGDRSSPRGDYDRLKVGTPAATLVTPHIADGIGTDDQGTRVLGERHENLYGLTETHVVGEEGIVMQREKLDTVYLIGIEGSSVAASTSFARARVVDLSEIIGNREAELVGYLEHSRAVGGSCRALPDLVRRVPTCTGEGAQDREGFAVEGHFDDQDVVLGLDFTLFGDAHAFDTLGSGAAGVVAD